MKGRVLVSLPRFLLVQKMAEIRYCPWNHFIVQQQVQPSRYCFSDTDCQVRLFHGDIQVTPPSLYEATSFTKMQVTMFRSCVVLSVLRSCVRCAARALWGCLPKNDFDLSLHPKIVSPKWGLNLINKKRSEIGVRHLHSLRKSFEESTVCTFNYLLQ